MNYKLIKKTCRRNDRTIKDLADKLDISYQASYTHIKHESLTIKRLEQIADILNISVVDFFDK